ncbi:Na+-transporting NADH:ubiquinone oxidoreductase subunit NqrC [Chitinophaga sp. OAE865]
MLLLIVSLLVACCVIVAGVVYAVNEQSKQWAATEN